MCGSVHRADRTALMWAARHGHLNVAGTLVWQSFPWIAWNPTLKHSKGEAFTQTVPWSHTSWQRRLRWNVDTHWMDWNGSMVSLMLLWFSCVHSFCQSFEARTLYRLKKCVELLTVMCFSLWMARIEIESIRFIQWPKKVTSLAGFAALDQCREHLEMRAAVIMALALWDGTTNQIIGRRTMNDDTSQRTKENL